MRFIVTTTDTGDTKGSMSALGCEVKSSNPNAERSSDRLTRKWLLSSSFSGHLLTTFATNILIACSGAATGIVAARLLGPQGRGELAAIQTWPTNIAALAMLGLAEATVYFSAREPQKSGRFLSSAVLLALLIGLPIMVLAYFLMPGLLAAQPAEVIHAARWYLFLIPLMAMVGMPFNALRGRGDLAVWNIMRVMPNVGWLAILIAALALGKTNPQWVAGGFLAALGFLFFPALAVTRCRVPGPFLPDHRLWKPMLAYGVPSAAGSVPQMFNLGLGQMLMAALLAPRLLGLYAVATAWSGATAPATSAIGAVVFPRVACEPFASAQAETLGRVMRLGSLAAAGMSVVVMIAAPVAIPLLFGNRFTPAVPAALILSFRGGVGGLNMIMEEGIRGLGDTKAILWSQLIGLVVTAVALSLLLRPYGIVGAAIASLLAYIAVTVSLVVCIQRRTGYTATALLLPRARDLALARQRILAIVRG